VLDGAYRRSADGAPVFVEVPAPTDDALQTVLHKIIVQKILTHLGLRARAPPRAPARGSQLQAA